MVWRYWTQWVSIRRHRSGKVFIDEVRADTLVCNRDDHSLNNLCIQIGNLRFNVIVPHFGNPENVYFSYKLEPYNDEWQSQDILQNNMLQFGGLSPGRYKLFMRVRNGFEPDQFEITVTEFRILKALVPIMGGSIRCVFLSLHSGNMGARVSGEPRDSKRKEELQRLVDSKRKVSQHRVRQFESQLHQLQTAGQAGRRQQGQKHD